jgi:DNA-binding LacI/PurR family transcriptional regulator
MTIAQIAKNLQLSQASVSRALNGQPGVGAETRARILAEAARLHFTLHSGARSLATTKTEHIGFALYHLPGPLAADPFYSRIMLGVEEELRQHGYHMLLTMLDDQQIARPEQWSVVHGRRVDGLVLAGPFIPPRFILSLHAQGVALVLVDNAIPNVTVDAVLGDDRDGARMAAEHLLGHGHQRIAVIAGPHSWYTTRERCYGFEDALKAAQISSLATIHAPETTYESGFSVTRDLLALKPTAILAVNDVMALGAAAAIQAAGMRVPEDIAVTGFDDIQLELGMLPLTTVRLRKRYVGRIAVRHLLQRIADPQSPQQRTFVTTELVVRRSCGCGAEGGQPPSMS